MNLVLAHGILGFRTISLFGDPINYFNGVKDFLETTFPDIPLKILITQVDPVRGINVRGTSLAEQIVSALGDGTLDSGDKTHIIAHSMGGLDARFILSPANPNNIANLITSLTTVSTPHQGSPIADLLFSAVEIAAPELFIQIMQRRIRRVIEELRIPFEGLNDLTTETTANFNKNFPDHGAVNYFSIAGQGRDAALKTCKLFLLSHLYIETVTGEKNDGLVAFSSASRDNLTLWPADHTDAVGHDLDGGPLAAPHSFNYLERYAEIVNRLRAL